MMPRIVPAVIMATILAGPAWAGSAAGPHTHPDTVDNEAAISIPGAARDAVATVDRFSTALASGDLEKAARELDSTVLILESGGAERSAAEYLGGHARSDAVFLQGAHQQLRHRTAHASGDFAWVASERELHFVKDGKEATMLSTETMVLRRGTSGWKIVHIHWSSRIKRPADGP